MVLEELENLSSDKSIEFVENNTRIKSIESNTKIKSNESAKIVDADLNIKSPNTELNRSRSIVKAFSDAYREIRNTYIIAEHYKRTCGSLSERVGKAYEEISLRQNDLTLFNKKSFIQFSRFINTVKEIKSFTAEISQIIGLQKYLQLGTVDQTFQKLKSAFDKHMKDLSLSNTTENQFQTEKDNEALKIDTESFNEYLEKIDGGITDPDHKINNNINEIFALKNTFNTFENDQSQIADMFCDEFLKIEDYNLPENSHGKAVKRTRKVDSVEFSFKEMPISRIYNNEVSILKRINNCHEIIKFFGLAKGEDMLYLVTEWAEFGNLNEYYKKYNLDYDLKLKFALDVARGLNFLTTVKILHRDIRSDNILITINKHAKIAHFGLSSKFADATKPIEFDIQSVRYTAPEKLLNSKYKYDIKCEVYSLGMLLWEIAELKIPYTEIDIKEFYYKIIVEQRREKFSHGGVPQEWKDLVKETWHQNPEFRPSFADIFLSLQKLIEQKFSLLDTNVNSTDEFHSQESESFFNFDELDWPESEREVREKQASQLFKEAADGGMADAQLMYGNCRINGVGTNKDTIKAVEYYEKAAVNNNPTAMYKVGNIYYHGDGVKQDLVKGEKFLRLAACNRQKLAVDM
ncbi:32999_t:CDS:2, partial [Racocetra persica]